MIWKVKFLQTKRGDSPVEKFILNQDDSTYAKVLHLINLLKNYGPYLKSPYSKKIQNKLYELRGPGKVAVRIFYTVINGEFYLIHAFKKKSQKIPSKELKIALDRLKEII